jgi:hypothetical protein
MHPMPDAGAGADLGALVDHGAGVGLVSAGHDAAVAPMRRRGYWTSAQSG